MCIVGCGVCLALPVMFAFFLFALLSESRALHALHSQML